MGEAGDEVSYPIVTGGSWTETELLAVEMRRSNLELDEGLRLIGASETTAILLLPASEDRFPLFACEDGDLWFTSGIELVWIVALGAVPMSGLSY